MEVEKATLLSIGEIKKTQKGNKLLNIDVSMPNGGPIKRFVIFENRQSRFDLVKLFERDVFVPGQLISFNFNKAQEDWQYDNIWKLKTRDEGAEESDSRTA
jgi:hypothetical protein